MNLSYKTTTMPGTLRTLHMLVINGEILTTTRKKELLVFAKPRINGKFHWKDFREAVRLEEALEIKD